MKLAHSMMRNKMTSNNDDLLQLSICIKQHLNEFDKVDKLMKKVTNDKNDLPKLMHKHNHLNVDGMLDDIRGLSPVDWMWEGSMHGEKHIQTCKHEFESKKGNFGQTLIDKTCTTNILQHLSSNIEFNQEDKYNYDNSEIKNCDDLQHKIENSLPTLLVLTHTNL